MWSGYCVMYVVVFLIRGQILPAIVAAVMAVVVGLALEAEVRNPESARPRLLGWTQDERQRSIHQQSLALVGWVALLAGGIAMLVAFIAAADQVAYWSSLVLVGVGVVYAIGLVIYGRRG
jgi:ABC-type Fe3+ transport system permease subunit